MATEPERRLVGTAWLVDRTGLARATIQQAAVAGRIPGAVKLLGVWRFDVEAIEQWIAASSTPAPAVAVQAPARVEAARSPHHTAIPPLAVLYPNAAHRGINDRPSEQPTRRPRRRVRS